MAECSTCYVDIEVTRIDGAPVCRECLGKIFQGAINEEANYPPSWGAQELDIDDYTNILPPDIVKNFKDKERIYSVPRNFRLFCAPRVGHGDCGNLIGDRRTFGTARPYPVPCGVCSRLTCTCGDPYLHAGHVCAADQGLGFPESERGITWQRCPNPECRMEAFRYDGCNHITCGICATHYCYLCGEQAHEPDLMNHWSRGGCVLYGSPGQQGAMFWDDVPNEMDEEEEEEEEEEEPDIPFDIMVDHAETQQDLHEMNGLSAALGIMRETITDRQARIVDLENDQRIAFWQFNTGRINHAQYRLLIEQARVALVPVHASMQTIQAEYHESANRAQDIFSWFCVSGLLSQQQLANIQQQILDETGLVLVG